MIKMLRISLVLARITQKGRSCLSHAAFVGHSFSSHPDRKISSVISAAASNKNPDDAAEADEFPPKSADAKRKIHQSRLASLYDEMFADYTLPQVSTPSSFSVQNNASAMNNEDYRMIDINTLQNEMDFDLDNEYPQDLPPEMVTEPINPPSPPQTPQPRQSRASPTMPVSGEKQSTQAEMNLPKPLIINGREIPTQIPQYYSQYDEEFGLSNEPLMDYHDGMIEELERLEKNDALENTFDALRDDIKSTLRTNEESTVVPPRARVDDEHRKEVDSAMASKEKSGSENQAPPSQMEQLPPRATSSSYPSASVEKLLDDTVTTKKKKNVLTPQTKILPRATSQLSTTIDRETLEIFRKSRSGTGGSDKSEITQRYLDDVQSEIFKLNNDVEFNINSPKQVSKVLFGVDTESTNKDALEALTGNISNTGGKARMASLILKYRKYHRTLKRIEKQNESKADGTYVDKVSSMRGSKSNVNANKVNPSSIVSPLGGGSENEEREPLVLIDASAYIFRAYYSMPPMHRYDGEPTGATLGFCNMLNKLVLTPMLRGEQPRVALIFDSKDGTNFRKKIYPEYKGNRPPAPEDLIPQFDFVKDAADAYGILQLEAPGFEADDVIATLSTMAVKEGCHVNILSGDKDLMQLVTRDDGGACVEMIDPMKMVRFCHDAVKEKWGVEPKLVGDILALAGDSADNIPGVPGIGPKIAATLIQEYGSLDALLDNVDSIKQKARREKLKANIEMARLSRTLVELERGLSAEEMSFPSQLNSVSEIRMEILDRDRLLKFYERMGFRDLKRRVQSRLPNYRRVASPIADKYSSITENAQRQSESVLEEHGGNGFTSASTFKSPPKAEDYPDVPF